MGFKGFPITLLFRAVVAAILSGLIGLYVLKSGTLTEGASMEFCLSGSCQNLGLTGWLDQQIVDMRVHVDTGRTIEH